MDDLPNILQDSYGLRPQGKSAPMASAKRGSSASSSPLRSTSASNRMPSRSPANSSFGDLNSSAFAGGGSAFKSSNSFSSDDVLGDIPLKKGNGSASSSPFGDDDIFGSAKVTANQPMNLGDDIFGPPRPPSKPPSSIFDELYGTNSGGNKAPGSDFNGDADFFGVGKASGAGNPHTYSATASNFDDLLGAGGYDAASKQKGNKGRHKATQPSAPSDDLLGGFSGESSPAGRRRVQSERPKPATSTPPTDPFGGVDVDPFFGSSAPAPPPAPSSGGAEFSDPFGPFFVPNTPPKNESASGNTSSINGNDGLSGLEAFAKYSSAESPRERRNRATRGEYKEGNSDKFDKAKSSSRRSNHGRETSAPNDADVSEGPEPRAPPKLSRANSSVAREAGISAREARERKAAEENNDPSYSSSQPSEGQKANDSKEGSWVTLEDVILKTKPLSTPPPNRPPPPVGAQKLQPSQSSKFHSPTETGKRHSESKSDRKMEVEPEVEPQPPPPSWHPPRRPSSNQSGEQTARNYQETAPGGFDSFEEFATSGRHRRTASERHPPSTNSQQEPARGDNLDGFDDFVSGGGSSRRRPPVDKSDSFPLDERGDRERRWRNPDNNHSTVPEQPARNSQDMNSSAEAADQSAAAMREVLERAKLKAEAARQAREREREKERQEVEAAAAKAKARAAEAQEQARVKAEAEARTKAEAEARAQAHAQAQQQSPDDLDAFFSAAPAKPQYESRQRQQERGPVNLDDLGASSRRQREPAKKSPPAPSPADNWAEVFGGVQVPMPNEAPLPGESEERRKLRLERERRIAERSAEALKEKNRRDADSAREQAERDRAGDLLDAEIKKWAAGKQGNLRALLSTLQFVLWPECNWEPLSITDLISAAAVKKAYRKATLCVHPDKVQQKGATVQQKYIAEKVFDLLKEAWNKFNSEELF